MFAAIQPRKYIQLWKISKMMIPVSVRIDHNSANQLSGHISVVTQTVSSRAELRPA